MACSKAPQSVMKQQLSLHLGTNVPGNMQFILVIKLWFFLCYGYGYVVAGTEQGTALKVPAAFESPYLVAS